MTTSLGSSTTVMGSESGGLPARAAVVRWAWRLFFREWRQQLLILALIVVAVGATVVAAAVAVNTPTPATAAFGTAQDLISYPGSDPHLAAQIADLEHRFGHVDVIENETLAIPGSIDTYDVRAQNPHGSFGGPLLGLLSGHFPIGADEVAVTKGVASAFDLRIGDAWRVGGETRQVVGIVENPQNLLDEFALVVPGQVTSPTQITVLFDAGGIPASAIGPNVQTPAQFATHNAINPETVLLVVVTLAMLLIALVSIGGFTVLTQRRLRSLGMLEALGATDRNVRLVVTANGVVVGVVGALLGLVAGLGVWLAYRPGVERSANHVIGAFALPWAVIAPAMALAVVATFLAASRPAHAITRVPIVAALSGRPAPPKPLHRSLWPGLLCLAIAFVLLSYSGTTVNAKPNAPELLLGLVMLIPAMILLSPFLLAAMARMGRRAPIAIRLALRDLSRYRARSGSALAAISLSVLVAVIVSIVAAVRYGNVLDYAGPNLASNQVVVYTPQGPNGPTFTAPQLQAMGKTTHHIATALGSRTVVELEAANASLNYTGRGRNFNGTLYVATPQLLAAFGIKASEINPQADILSMRPGLSGISGLQLVWGNFVGNLPPNACPRSHCLANPMMEEVGALPSGTSAPNTVITEHAVRELHLQASVSGWLIETPQPPTAAQVRNARLTASGAGLTIETRNSIPSGTQVLDWATTFGIVLVLAILAMSVGLIRSETSRDLRTLAASGASSYTRRTITGATTAALGFIGALLGIVGGYVAVIGYIRGNSLNGGISALGSVPVGNLLALLVGMPLVAGAAAWLLAGRQPPAMARQPIE